VAIRAATAADIPAVRGLFEEYQRGLGVSLCFQGFDAELAGLPGDYAPPRGGLWLADEPEGLAGCVALRALDPATAELKRLFVRDAFRGRGIGRLLALRAIAFARAAGYSEVKLDTLPRMAQAQTLYAALGFRDIAPYNDNPVGGVRFMGLDLRAVSSPAS
jgi:putative acetyltransferase